jgi:hypothetical protein
MQNYLPSNLKLSLTNDPLLQPVALQIISMVALRGHVHPLMCIPHLVALSTSSRTNIRDAALSTFSQLNQKYPSMMNAKIVEGVKTSWEFHINYLSSSSITGKCQLV